MMRRVLRAVTAGSAAADARQLHTAMRGPGTDESVLTEILGRSTDHHIQEIAVAYKSAFGKELDDDIRSEFRRNTNYSTMITMLAESPVERDVEYLHSSLSGIGVNEAALIEILATRNNAEMQAIKVVYARKHGASLESVVEGKFRAPRADFKNVLLKLLAADRRDYLEPVAVRRYAEMIYRAGEGRPGTDEAKLIEVFTTVSAATLHLVANAYAELHSSTLENAIQKETNGALEDALLMILRCSQPARLAEYYANEIHDNARSHMDKVVRILVTERDRHLHAIKAAFAQKFNTPLKAFLQQHSSRDLEQLLEAVVESA